VHGVVADWRQMVVDPVDRALCEFAVKLTRREQPMVAADLDGLRALGLSDRAIHDTTQVVAYFNYITRVAEALGVDLEEFIPPWGR
jgi:uncharacterized peroxidase-related enzyme